MAIREEDMKNKYDILWEPEKYGYKECEVCGGYGNTNRRVGTEFFGEDCGKCGGDGVLPVTIKPAGSGEPDLEELGLEGYGTPIIFEEPDSE